MVLPRLVELAMRNRRLAPYREQAIKAARGRVLEIGIGSGLNLPIYGAAVDQVCGIDPSPGLLDRASKRMGDAHIRVSLTPTRRLAAILAADVAGYLRLIGSDEQGTLNRLRSI